MHLLDACGKQSAANNSLAAHHGASILTIFIRPEVPLLMETAAFAQ